MDRVCGIYKIENVVNGHMYIGSSNNIERRMQGHSNALDNGSHDNDHLQKAFNKYGFDNFVYDVLIECDPDMLLYYEQRFLDAWHPDYNISYIAGKIEMNEEVRNKISASNMGREVSEETRIKISISCTGKIHSEETKKKISASNSGIEFTDEHRHNLSKSLSGRTLSEHNRMGIQIAMQSEEVRSKISNSLKGKTLGCKFTDEHKHNMSIAQMGNKHWLGRTHTEDTKQKMRDSWVIRKERERLLRLSQ